MVQHTYRHAVVVLILVGVFGLAGVVAATGQETRRAEAAAPLPGVDGKIEAMQVVVHHDAARSPSHVYRQFSLTRVQTEGDLLIIEGRLSDAAGRGPANVLIKLRTPHRNLTNVMQRCTKPKEHPPRRSIT